MAIIRDGPMLQNTNYFDFESIQYRYDFEQKMAISVLYRHGKFSSLCQ